MTGSPRGIAPPGFPQIRICSTGRVNWCQFIFSDPDNAVTQYGYATPSNHLLTTETNPNGGTATAPYNSLG